MWKLTNSIKDNSTFKVPLEYLKMMVIIASIYNVYNGQYENQECLFLTEDGLYEVLMQSNTD